MSPKPLAQSFTQQSRNFSTPAEDIAIPSAPLAASRKALAPQMTVLARRSCFQMTVDDGPQALLRLLGLFAARDFTPASVRATQEQDMLYVEVMVDGMDEASADIVAQKARMMVGTRDCLLSRFARV